MIIGKSITTLGGGGLKPTIVVTAPTGSTVTCDGIAGIEVSGVWTFTVELGTHTIVATKGSSSKTETVLVDATAIFEVSIVYSDIHTKFLLHGDSYNDASMYNVATSTGGNISISSAQAKFGSYSIRTTGVGTSSEGYLEFNSTDVGIDVNGTYTVEMWVYPTTITTINMFIYTCTTNGYFFSQFYQSYGVGVGRTATAWDYQSGAYLSANTWQHLAIVGNNKNFKVFIGGVKQAETTLSRTYTNGGTVRIFKESDCYFNEYRISDIARYSSNFTPPTEPFN